MLSTPRRGLIARVATTLAAGLAALAPGEAQAAPADGPNWPGKALKPHKLVVDGYTPSGRMLDFAHTFLATNAPGSASVALILRAGALPLALDSHLWEKYRIGESLKIIDPETKAPATKNPWLRPKPGVLQVDAAALDRLAADGAIIGACAVALRGQAARLAANAGVTAEEAAREWAANLIPGATLLPSGVWGLSRAQEAGCAYCTGGG
jgi:hypothetical protein